MSKVKKSNKKNCVVCDSDGFGKGINYKKINCPNKIQFSNYAYIFPIQVFMKNDIL